MAQQYLIDISNYQAGMTDFKAVARDGYAGAIILASDGSWSQPYFGSQLARVRGAGLLAAAYHYQRANVAVQTQVDVIVRQVPVDVPVIIDVEHYSGSGTAGVDMTRAIIAGLRQRGYRSPLVYIPRWYWSSPVTAPKGGLGFASLAGLPPLWISWYPDYVTRSKENGAAMLPASVWVGYGGLDVAIAQFTSSGRVPGYGSDVDQNVYRGTREQLAALLGGAGGVGGGGGGTNGTDGFLMGLEQWQQDRLYNRVLMMSQGVAGQNFNGEQFQHEENARVAMNAKLDAIAAGIAGIANDRDITPEALKAIVDESTARAAEQQAEIVTERIRASLQTLVEEALARMNDADNVDEAKRTVEELLRRVGQLSPNVADHNEDGVRGGAAAPEGVGGPTAGDITNDSEGRTV